MPDPALDEVPRPTCARTPVPPPDLTVIVPTRDESGNVAPLLRRIAAAAGSRTVEVLVVDDSDDETPQRVRELADRDPAAPVRVRLIHREAGERRGGLGGAVAAGLRAATAEWAVVMDGDLQHPPELALQLPDVGRHRDLDLVVASRHVPGGDAHGLAGGGRRAVSGCATLLAKAVFPRSLAGLSDPMTGLFAVRRAAIDADGLRPIGFKILMELKVRHPELRVAEVPFSMHRRAAGASKASVREGIRFARHLMRLRTAPRVGTHDRGVWLVRAALFGLVGLSGLVVNTGALVIALQVPGLHYLAGAVLATEASTAWLFVLTDRIVFRGPKPGTVRSRAARFFLLNHAALLVRLPLLALLVETIGLGVVPANIATLVLLFLVRFVVADTAIYREPPDPSPPAREPMRVVVSLTVPETPAAPAPRPERNGHARDGAALGVVGPDRRPVPGTGADRYLPYRYAIPGIATIGSQVRLRELEYFRAQYLGNDTEIQVRVAPSGGARPRLRACMTRTVEPAAIAYAEHLGRLGANFTVRLGEPIVVTVAPPLAHSPHVVYTNVVEALLRFVAISKGVMLLHSACLELDGAGVLISAETDTGKTGTVLRLVREHGARFLSDDMTVLHADGRVGCFPKPLTISHHTLRAIGNDELTPGEWRRLRLQSRLHSREGRRFAMVLSRLNIPIMGINALTQRIVPPPKYAVDRLLPCTILPEARASRLFVISRGPHGSGALERPDALHLLLANTEDAYQFPPFRQLAPSVAIGGDDIAGLRRKERAILRAALDRVRCRWIATPDFSWADRIADMLHDERTAVPPREAGVMV